MSDPFVGEIRMIAGTFAPRDWAYCDGQLVNIAQNTALYSIIGTTYGGDGMTTMGLPNLTGRVTMHFQAGPGMSYHVLGEMGGNAYVRLNAGQLPGHTHQLKAVNINSDTKEPATHALAKGNDPDAPKGQKKFPIYASSGTAAAMSPDSLAATGGGQDHNNMQPFLPLSFVISLYGAYPSRS